MSAPAFAVLEDDPTGTQLLGGVPLLLDWAEPLLASAAAERPPALHVLTNSRALAPAAAEALTREISRAIRRVLPNTALVLRGDSTLRAHVLEEYRAVASVVHPGEHPVLVLSPALPSAGRITRGGVHWLRASDTLTPLHETEYARDGVFAYADARLLQWAADRSGGWFQPGDGAGMTAEELHAEGPGGVAGRLASLAEPGRPAVFAPDAETLEDQEAIAEGVRRALAGGVPLVVRSSPSFAGALCGTLAAEPVALPDRAATLVVCGSYVPGSRRQLDALLTQFPDALVELDLAAAGEAELQRASAELRRRLDSEGVAALATPAVPPAESVSLVHGKAVMDALVNVVRRTRDAAEVVVAKGGITSAMVLRDGLGAGRADVLGPVEPGVALLQARTPAGPTPYLIVPGNVGDDDVLARLLRRLSISRPAVLRDTV